MSSKYMQTSSRGPVHIMDWRERTMCGRLNVVLSSWGLHWHEDKVIWHKSHYPRDAVPCKACFVSAASRLTNSPE